MSYFVPPSTTQYSIIRSRSRTDVPEVYSSVRSVKDLLGQDYCDPHDPCCVNKDPEVFLQESVLRLSSRKVCAPKNPLHFEYNILHRFKLRKMLLMAAERQQNEDLTEEELAEIKRLEEEEDTSQKLQAHITMSKAINLAVSNKPETEVPPPPGKIVEDPKDLENHFQGLTNMALAHEIALNKDFKMKKTEEAGVSGNEAMNQQIQLALDAKDKYWARVDHVLLKKDLKNYKHLVIDVFSTMKTALEGTILPHNWSMREKIDQELNMHKITKQIDSDVFDLRYYVDFILDTLTALCCPVRDKEIVEIRDTPLLSRQLRRILDLVEVINLDMANFVMSQSRAHTMQNCIMYERNKFATYVESEYRAGLDPLVVTRRWIRKNSVPEMGFSEAMSHAFLEVLEWEEDKEFPETLSLDWSRLPSIREEIKRVTVMGTIVSLVYEHAITLLKDVEVGEKGNVQEEKEHQTPQQKEFEKSQLVHLKNLRLMSKLREALNPLLSSEDIKDMGTFQEALRNCGETAGEVVDQHKQDELCSALAETEKLKIQQIVLPLTNLNHEVRQGFYGQIRDWFFQLAKEDGKAKIDVPEQLRIIGPLIIVPITEMIRLTMYNRGVFDILYREIFDGNCGPPMVFPPRPEDKNPDSPVILDANKYGQEDDDDAVMDENITAVLHTLKGFKGRSMVYRRARVDPRMKPMFEADGTPIIPPERQPEYVPKQMTAIEQKHFDDHIIATEPTKEEDYEGVYNFNNIGDPDFMMGYTTEQLLRLMERENLINANKLKRVKERLNQEVLHQRVADNLPVFYKLWGKDFGIMNKEFCRLQRILEKGELSLPPGATDEASGLRKLPLSCLPPPPPPPELPRVNEKGEKLIYAGEGRSKFGVNDTPPSGEAKFDFEGVAKALGDVKEVDPETLLTFPSSFRGGGKGAPGVPETVLDKMLRNIPKPDPHWKMLDFRVRIPKSKSNRFKWSRMMESMERIQGGGTNPNSPIAQFGSPSQRQTPNFTTTWTPEKEQEAYTGAREGHGGRGAPTSNQTVIQMEIPIQIGKTAIMMKADKPLMPATSDPAPAVHSSNLPKSRKVTQKKAVPVFQTMLRFPTVPAPKRQVVQFRSYHKQQQLLEKRRLCITARQKMMIAQQELRSRQRGEMQFRPPPLNPKRRYSFDSRQPNKS